MTSPFATQRAPRHDPAQPRPERNAPGPRQLRSVAREPRSGRWITTLGGFAFCVIAAVLFGLAILNAVIVQQQRSIDETTTELHDATARHERLRVELTGLEAPDRIMSVATADLGMVAIEPSQVTYLTAAHGELDPVFVAATIDAAGR